MSSVDHLFSRLALRPVTLRNRIVISPMQQYMAGSDGLPRDFHLQHYGRLGIGGAGLIFTEALANTPAGRVTHHDLGIWTDEQTEALKPMVARLASRKPGMTIEKPLFEARHVHAWYGKSHIVQGVDITIHDGELVALLGRNGTGKTTTMRAITGLLPRTEGSITFAGENCSACPPTKSPGAACRWCPSIAAFSER
jgi:ABC-type multidrug transport system fused ATPase/permease subunit